MRPCRTRRPRSQRPNANGERRLSPRRSPRRASCASFSTRSAASAARADDPRTGVRRTGDETSRSPQSPPPPPERPTPRGSTTPRRRRPLAPGAPPATQRTARAASAALLAASVSPHGADRPSRLRGLAPTPKSSPPRSRAPSQPAREPPRRARAQPAFLNTLFFLKRSFLSLFLSPSVEETKPLWRGGGVSPQRVGPIVRILITHHRVRRAGFPGRSPGHTAVRPRSPETGLASSHSPWARHSLSRVKNRHLAFTLRSHPELTDQLTRLEYSESGSEGPSSASLLLSHCASESELAAERARYTKTRPT